MSQWGESATDCRSERKEARRDMGYSEGIKKSSWWGWTWIQRDKACGVEIDEGRVMTWPAFGMEPAQDTGVDGAIMDAPQVPTRSPQISKSKKKSKTK